MKKKQFKVQTETLGEVTVETRGKKGIYHVSFRFEGKHRRRTLGSSNWSVAKENLSQIALEFAKAPTGKVTPPRVESRRSELLLTEGLGFYLDSLRDRNVEEKRGLSQPRMRIDTFISFEKQLGVECFSGVLATHGDLFYRGLIKGTVKSKGKNKKGANTAVGYIRSVKAMMNYLESRDLIDQHPWRRVSFPRIDHAKTPKPNLRQVDEILERIDPNCFVAASALAFMGCRAAALLRTKPSQVKLKDGFIIIEPPPHRSKTVARVVPVHPRLKAVLERYQRPRSPYYFCTLPSLRSKGGKQMSVKTLNAAIQNAAKDAGYPVGRKENGFVAHSLRGFFKSHCIKQRVPREVIDIWQGHRDDNSVGTRHYFELELDESIEFMNTVDFGSF